METDLAKRRYPWLAGFLSLTGVPIGQLYSGHLWRAIVLAVTCLVVLPISTFFIIRLPLPRLFACLLLVFVFAIPILLAIDAFFLTRRKRFAPLARYQRWWVYLLAFLAASCLGTFISYGIRLYVAEAFIVPGRAMLPTIQHNDRILVDKFYFDPSELHRNDLAVYWSPDPESQSQLKRILGLPGETVEIRNEQLFIDGGKISDRNAIFDADRPLIPELTNFGPITIPEGSYFVLGDNRRLSKDSRIEGPISFDSFIGVARAIYWSNDYEFVSDLRAPPVCGAIRWDRIGKRLD